MRGLYWSHMICIDQSEASSSQHTGQFGHKLHICRRWVNAIPTLGLTLPITIPIHMYAHVLEFEFLYTSCVFLWMYFSYLELILTHRTGKVLGPLRGLNWHDDGNLGNHYCNLDDDDDGRHTVSCWSVFLEYHKYPGHQDSGMGNSGFRIRTWGFRDWESGLGYQDSGIWNLDSRWGLSIEEIGILDSGKGKSGLGFRDVWPGHQASEKGCCEFDANSG